MSSNEFKIKTIKTCNLKYGVNNPAQSKIIKDKSKRTKLLRYGSETYNNPLKTKRTNVEKYGVEAPSQNSEIFKKQQTNSYLLNKFKDTNIYYQGSYELDFLEKFHEKYHILRGPTIKYTYYDKLKIYHADFFISSLNLIIEIKNSYLMKKDKEIIEAKEKATISNGFNYLVIVDKNYDEFYRQYESATCVLHHA